MLKQLLTLTGVTVMLAAVLLSAGCSKSDSSSGPAPGTPGSTINVTGTVVGENSQPVPSVPVVITGKASTNTDANGNFTFTNVTIPYDIVVVSAANKSSLIYKGLTRSDPTLTFLGTSPSVVRSTTLSGKVSGGTFTPNQGASDRTGVAFVSPEVNFTTSTTVSGTFGPSGFSWYGPASTTGSLYALQWTTDGSGLPVAGGYKGYGARAGLTLNDGSSNTFNDTLVAVGTSQFTGTVTVASGYTLTGKVMLVQFPTRGALSILSDPTANAAMSYFTPAIPNATILLRLLSSKPAGGSILAYKSGIAPGATGLAITLPSAPEQSLPINGATGVDTTVTFSWTAFAGGVHLAIFQSPGNPTYLILTSGTSTTLPNLKTLGLGLPSSGTYTWGVYGFAPFGSTDAAAGGSGFLAGILSPNLVRSDSYVGLSTTRSFTTAP